jgi:hypothetical protein
MMPLSSAEPAIIEKNRCDKNWAGQAPALGGFF